MHPNTPYKELHKLLERNGMDAVSLHSLRHTNATLLIGSGADVRTVSGRLPQPDQYDPEHLRCCSGVSEVDL